MIGQGSKRPRVGDQGSAPVEFILVGAILTVLTLGVLQVAVAVYVRNVVHDAAVVGAYTAALADTSDADGIAHTREVITRTVGTAYAGDVDARRRTVGGVPMVRIEVHTRLPVFGMLGVEGMLEVHGDAPVQRL